MRHYWIIYLVTDSTYIYMEYVLGPGATNVKKTAVVHTSVNFQSFFRRRVDIRQIIAENYY